MHILATEPKRLLNHGLIEQGRYLDGFTWRIGDKLVVDVYDDRDGFSFLLYWGDSRRGADWHRVGSRMPN